MLLVSYNFVQLLDRSGSFFGDALEFSTYLVVSFANKDRFYSAWPICVSSISILGLFHWLVQCWIEVVGTHVFILFTVLGRKERVFTATLRKVHSSPRWCHCPLQAWCWGQENITSSSLHPQTGTWADNTPASYMQLGRTPPSHPQVGAGQMGTAGGHFILVCGYLRFPPADKSTAMWTHRAVRKPAGLWLFVGRSCRRHWSSCLPYWPTHSASW